MELTAYFHGICNINAPEETTIKPKKQQKKKTNKPLFLFLLFPCHNQGVRHRKTTYRTECCWKLG
jgi:hypothetical protein